MQRRKIICKIFGENGAVSSSDHDVFKEKLDEVKCDLREITKNDKFFRYVDNTVHDSLLFGVVLPARRANIPGGWKIVNMKRLTQN